MKTNFYLVDLYSSNCMPIISVCVNGIVTYKNVVVPKVLHLTCFFNIFYQLNIK